MKRECSETASIDDRWFLGLTESLIVGDDSDWSASAAGAEPQIHRQILPSRASSLWQWRPGAGRCWFNRHNRQSRL